MMSAFILFAAVLISRTSEAGSFDPPVKDKVIAISVNQYSQAIIGRDTLTIADLAKELETRLWKSFLSTGKTYDAIQLDFAEGVSQPVRMATIAAIKTAQNNVLKNISLERDDKLFDDLSADKQRRIKKQFPVLFQEF